MRRGIVSIILIFILGALVCAQEGPPENYTGTYWWPNPDPLGAYVGTAVTKESGQPLDYEVTSTDKDKAQQYQNGEPIGSPELLYNPTFYVDTPEPPRPEINSCMPGGYITFLGRDGATHKYEFHGITKEHLTENRTETDNWWFDDVAEMGEDWGVKDDPALGPCGKTVHITPSHGWVYGKVTDEGGTPQPGAWVELWEGGGPWARVLTNDAGAYEIRPVETGAFTVKVVGPPSGETSGTVTKGQGTKADIVLHGEGEGGGG